MQRTEGSQEEIRAYQQRNMYDADKHYNPHDVAGVPKLTEAQTKLLELKKVEYRVNNETYLRKHPELQNMIKEKPKDILNYAGKYFDQADLAKIIDIESKHYDSNKQAGL